MRQTGHFLSRRFTVFNVVNCCATITMEAAGSKASTAKILRFFEEELLPAFVTTLLNSSGRQ